MSVWKSCKAKQLLAALKRIGWEVIRTRSSHKTLRKEGYRDVLFAYHDRDEIGPAIVSRIAKDTGLKPEDL